MKLLKKITALVMSLVIFCTMATPVFAAKDKSLDSRADYIELLEDEGYPAISTVEAAQIMKTCSDFFRLMTNDMFPSEERIEISFDKRLTEANLYVVENCGIDMEAILKSLPPLNRFSSLVMETFEIGPRDMFYVLLKYVKLKDENLKITHSTSWPFYKGWIAPQHNKDGAIIGVGASNSFEYARKCMAYFEKNHDGNFLYSYYGVGDTIMG